MAAVRRPIFFLVAALAGCAATPVAIPPRVVLVQEAAAPRPVPDPGVPVLDAPVAPGGLRPRGPE
ncbi:MAG: hypothetical protein FJ098_03285, partial [Deltaproteobacteria bacterium]|nr:hypothetical protein [Deltaproteobacteria bacterium]